MTDARRHRILRFALAARPLNMPSPSRATVRIRVDTRCHAIRSVGETARSLRIHPTRTAASKIPVMSFPPHPNGLGLQWRSGALRGDGDLIHRSCRGMPIHRRAIRTSAKRSRGATTLRELAASGTPDHVPPRYTAPRTRERSAVPLVEERSIASDSDTTQTH